VTLELDHFFILTDTAPHCVEQLTALGLIEGSSNSHTGQGTANHRFFCRNLMLELLHISDAAEANNGPAGKLRLTERSGSDTASPFGLVFKQGGGSQKEPFPGWRYHPDYFSGVRYFHIGESADRLVEPLCIYMPFDLQPTKNEPSQASRFDRITKLIISVPVGRPSAVLEAAAECELISIRLNEPHGMEVVFNQARDGQVQDLRPAMPLVVHW
jgi:hypothetical protein